MSTFPKTNTVCWFFILLLQLSCGPLYAAENATGPHIRVSLISEDTAVVPGGTHFVGIFLEPEHHWHTYWRNPGDSGEPPKVSWKLPEGVGVGELQMGSPIAATPHLAMYCLIRRGQWVDTMAHEPHHTCTSSIKRGYYATREGSITSNPPIRQILRKRPTMWMKG